MNRYKYTQNYRKPTIDFELKIGSKVRLREDYVLNEKANIDKVASLINRGIITGDMEDRWEVEWKDKQTTGPHPYKNIVEYSN